PGRNLSVLHGGVVLDTEDGLADTWILDPNGDQWVPGPTGAAPGDVGDGLFAIDRDGRYSSLGAGGGPPGRARAAMAHDPGRNLSVLHGGVVLDTEDGLADTWILDPNGDQWVPGPTGGPRAAAAAMVYDPLRDKLVVPMAPPSIAKVPPTDVFELDLGPAGRLDQGRWTAVTTEEGPRPAARRQPATLFDPEREAIVLHGGQRYTERDCHADTWLLPTSAEARPAWIFEVDAALADVPRTDVRAIEVRASGGGRGYEDARPGPGAPVDGVRIELWDAGGSRWVTTATAGHPAEAPDIVSGRLESPTLLARVLDDRGRLRVRFTPSTGVGTGPGDGQVRVSDPTVVLHYGPRLPDACGDGRMAPFANESCDDGNTSNGDGCSESCRVEPGFTCTETDAAGRPTGTSRCLLGG
ncbi:MAG: myxococcus cysteine-rich repeat containing protein, partial [Myxococcota bacterium]